jgi:hypothetical protein
MSYEIENYGPQNSGPGNKNNNPLPSGGGTPNFPPNYTAGQETLAWGNDLIADPTDTGDVTEGWQRGIGIGGVSAG